MLCCLTLPLWAGGSGLNVAIVINQNSSNSIQLGNYYRELRQVPPQNVLRINWPGSNVLWTQTEFNNTLFTPLSAMLASRQLTNQIDYIVLSMDIPYRVTTAGNGENSTTSALFYGFKPDSRDINTCPLAFGSTSAYAGSEGIFRSTPPINATSNSFLVTMITSSNLALAKQIVNQGVLGDATFPTQTVYLAKSPDIYRNIRYLTFDNALFNTRLRGNYSMLRTNFYSPGYFPNMLGYENGTYAFSIDPNAFVPGAMADQLTSFGGQVFQDNGGQTTSLSFLQAGAAGSFGTVIEPCAYLEKFPDPQNYFYQARGFSLAECYYQSLTNPYQGLVVGEPLSAPFAQSANVSWIGLTSNALLSASSNLTFQFTAMDALHPVQQVDLFLDGNWLQTVTNIPPRQGNVLNVTLNGHSMNYTVPASATIKSVASGLANTLNSTINLIATKVQAIAHGDRIELQSSDSNKTGVQIPIIISNSAAPLTTFIAASRTNFLDSVAWGYKTYDISGTVTLGSFLRVTVTRTNGTPVSLGVTNNTGGTTLTQLTQQLLDLINTNVSPSLQGNDGLAGEDLLTNPFNGAVEFHLRAIGPGYAAAQIQASLSSSPGLTVTPLGTATLTENLPDLQPRNHLYITAGITNLSVTFPFNTSSLPDGYHELTAVAYEGSHVHTQARATQNNSLAVTFTALMGGTNTALEATLQFAVTANTNNISRIELFSTGGSLASATNQSTATFSFAATNLGLGLHPFYVLVTDTNGRQYRTETQWIRLVNSVSPFALQISSPPLVLTWAATAGRPYDILSTSNINSSFQLRETIIPTNSLARWTETNGSPTQLFYRIRVNP
jgi:uncharacterized protein (TIGR03790 family)